MINTNGNGGATAIPPRIVRGASVAHRDLDKRQRACLAAQVLAGEATYQPTRKELSELFDVSGPYIDVARKFFPEKRYAIIEGCDSTSFTALCQPIQLALPQPKADSPTLFDMIVTHGLDETLSAAVAVEQSMSR